MTFTLSKLGSCDFVALEVSHQIGGVTKSLSVLVAFWVQLPRCGVASGLGSPRNVQTPTTPADSDDLTVSLSLRYARRPTLQQLRRRNCTTTLLLVVGGRGARVGEWVGEGVSKRGR